jgi:Ala-tRNA(Pro) deacylase
MDIISYLMQQKVEFEHLRHAEKFTAQEIAAAQHVPGRDMVKAVLIKADGKFILAVLPAIFKINLVKLKDYLGAQKLELAGEDEMRKVFADVDVGAEPPFGNLYNVETVVDHHLTTEAKIVFQAGTHTDTVRMRYADYEKLVKPRVARFGDHI